MKNKKDALALSNLFDEFEKADLTGKQLDDELITYGFDPKELARKVRERINVLKTGRTMDSFSKENREQEFNPFLLAAKNKGNKKKK